MTHCVWLSEDRSIIFNKPSLPRDSAWLGHVPFGMFLVDLLKPKKIVELGVHVGVSYCSFCQIVRERKIETQCFGIDSWEGEKHSGFYTNQVLKELKAFHDPLYGSFSTLVQAYFDDALSMFSDASIDLLHIDGLHTYEAVKHDFEQWFPKLSQEGVVMFHDIHERRDDFGVWRLWDELKEKYPSFEFKHSHGLGIISVGSKEEKFRSFVNGLDEKEKHFIKLLFESLGTNLEQEQTIRMFDKRIAEECLITREKVYQSRTYRLGAFLRKPYDFLIGRNES